MQINYFPWKYNIPFEMFCNNKIYTGVQSLSSIKKNVKYFINIFILNRYLDYIFLNELNLI